MKEIYWIWGVYGWQQCCEAVAQWTDLTAWYLLCRDSTQLNCTERGSRWRQWSKASHLHNSHFRLLGNFVGVNCVTFGTKLLADCAALSARNGTLQWHYVSCVFVCFHRQLLLIAFSALLDRTEQLQTRKHDGSRSVCLNSELDSTVQCDMHVDRVQLKKDFFVLVSSRLVWFVLWTLCKLKQDAQPLPNPKCHLHILGAKEYHQASSILSTDNSGVPCASDSYLSLYGRCMWTDTHFCMQ